MHAQHVLPTEPDKLIIVWIESRKCTEQTNKQIGPISLKLLAFLKGVSHTLSVYLVKMTKKICLTTPIVPFYVDNHGFLLGSSLIYNK